jgi:hypothetical protein
MGHDDMLADRSVNRAMRGRVFHLTFYKCGSQWVRDILSDPLIVDHSRHPLGVSGVDLRAESWPQIAPGALGSPLYCAGRADWQHNANAGDRAVVVIRDPRDIVVSLLSSLLHSHASSTTTMLLREPLAHASPRDRLQIGMFVLAQWVDYLRSWRDTGSIDTVCVCRYESLVDDLAGELSRVFAFLRWPIPSDIVLRVAAYHSFASRTGRQPGEENYFSHRRKGIVGDWRNHFDRSAGECFEHLFPTLLSDFGYEATAGWWQHLPSAIPPRAVTPEDERARLMAVLQEYEQEVAVVRVAAAERLAALLSEREDRRMLERSIAWRFGFRPLRAVIGLGLRILRRDLLLRCGVP